MLRVLILYGTTTGQTAKIANALAATFRHRGASADVVNAVPGIEEMNLEGYAAVVVAAPVRVGRYPKVVQQWVLDNVGMLGDRPTAFVSVCLGVLQHDPKVDADIAGIMERFFEATHWRPTTHKVVAGGLFYRRYSWITRWFMRRIVAKAHGDTDTTRDYEYTDWKDLERFAETFYDEHVAPAATRGRTPGTAA